MSNHLKAIAEELKSIAENHIKVTHPKATIKCHISSSDSIPVFKKTLENWLRSPHIV